MSLKDFFLVVLTFYSVTADTKLSLDPESEIVTYRLPNNTIPTHYDIFISTSVHIPDFRFSGVATIDIKVLENSSRITVQYQQLEILNVDLLDINNELIERNVNFLVNEKFEFVIISPKAPLVKDSNLKVKISYRGVLRTDDFGFYRARYTNENGTVIWFATTQFQATYARHAFPSYDEPNIRTSFDITIHHYAGYRALSNMPVDSIVSDSDGYSITKFQRVPSIPTYLVAITVCDFIFAEDRNVVPPQRIYARPETIHNKEYEFALEISPQIMTTCEKYFGSNYTFPKMDQIAVTNFFAGAMENWGLVSYREQFLLFDPLLGTTYQKQFIIAIIAHEFAHQWLGNIVSPEWWVYLWINEGFASIYENFIPHLTYPEQRFDDLFLVDKMQPVMEIDADPNVRYLSYYVEDPDSIESLFDPISYSKAGSVLHTFMHAFGLEVWQEATRNLIEDRFHNYHNSDYLYAAIQRAVDANFQSNSINVAELMKTWEFQSGFPLVTVTRSSQGSFIIRQERFFYDQKLQSNNIWAVPISFVTASNANFESTRFDFWLTQTQQVLTNSSTSKFWNENDWIILNVRQSYYYRVNYEADLWRLLIEQLNKHPESYKKIHLRNRAQLINDAFHLSKGKRLDYGVIFGIMNYLWQETDYIPWVPSYYALRQLNLWLRGSTIYSEFQNFVRHSTRKYYAKLGVVIIDDELFIDRHARSVIISLACEAQLSECLVDTNRELVAHLQDGKRVAPDYISTIYCNGMRKAMDLHFTLMKNRLFISSDFIERIRIINGLSCTQNSDLINDFLNLVNLPSINLSAAEKFRILFMTASQSEMSLEVLIRFVREHYKSIQNIRRNALNDILRHMAYNIGSNRLLNNYTALLSYLFRNRVINQANFIRSRNAALTNLKWQSENMEKIVEFFDSRKSGQKISD